MPRVPVWHPWMPQMILNVCVSRSDNFSDAQSASMTAPGDAPVITERVCVAPTDGPTNVPSASMAPTDVQSASMAPTDALGGSWSVCGAPSDARSDRGVYVWLRVSDAPSDAPSDALSDSPSSSVATSDA